MSVEISQRMFSEIMPAFIEMAEMFIMKTTRVYSQASQAAQIGSMCTRRFH